MSPRLLAATDFFVVFFSFPAQGVRRRGVTIRKPPQLHASMHHSWAGNETRAAKTTPGKTRKLWFVKRMIVSLRFKELAVKSSILIRQPCVTVCPWTFYVGALPKPKKTLAVLSFGSRVPVFRGHVHKLPLESNLFLSTQVVEIHADDVFEGLF